jgi:hypothetical protein
MDRLPQSQPVLVCEAPLPPGAKHAGVQGHALPVPKAMPRRIVVIGDTGCRLKRSDAAFKACNDPDGWPFPGVAAEAAASPGSGHHVGDYHYRENACPPGNAAARAALGYGWDTWDADFFTPARARCRGAIISLVATTNPAIARDRAGGACSIRGR